MPCFSENHSNSQWMKEDNETEESKQQTISRGFVIEMLGERMPRNSLDRVPSSHAEMQNN